MNPRWAGCGKRRTSQQRRWRLSPRCTAQRLPVSCTPAVLPANRKEDTRLRPVRLRPVAEVEIGRSRTGRSLIDLHSQPKIIFIIIIIITFTCFFLLFRSSFFFGPPSPGPPSARIALRQDRPKFRVFFSLSRHNFHSSFFLSRILSWFFGCVRSAGASNVHVWICREFAVVRLPWQYHARGDTVEAQLSRSDELAIPKGTSAVQRLLSLCSVNPWSFGSSQSSNCFQHCTTKMTRDAPSAR